ncbi:hypothetical protein K1719_034518 [Acacia pycnantha]|nr:hypothetical protein K1719_034518 [Acacia pycnantha]
MESHTPLSFLLLLLLLSLLSLSHARTFYAGNQDGWVLNPSDSYAQWSSRNRFLINDVVVFKYQKGSDSVLEWA